jgi:hypothetical protein
MALALALALAGVLPQVVQAQQPAGATPLTFHYRDADGEGILSVLDVGADEATGGRQITVTLVQNGARSVGSGVMLPLEKTPPFHTAIIFSLVRRRGAAFLFQGQTTSGITLSGQGTFHRSGFPERKSAWSIVLGGAASGIQGVAMAGPIFPVERPGVPNERPLPDAIITVQPEGGGAEIARQRTDKDGKFQIILPPGTYLLVPLAPDPNARLPRGERQTVKVASGKFTEVVVRYDTGIR